MSIRLIRLIRFLVYLPQVKTSYRKVSLREKVKYTVISLLVYLVGSQLPLYGRINSTIRREPPFHPLSWLLIIFASNCGTVMELGTFPVVVPCMLTPSVLGDTHLLWNRDLLHAKQKLQGIMLSFYVAYLFVLSGMYGRVDQLGTGNAILIIFQLWFAGIIVIFLDELLQKGYGFGSGISLFSATNICQNIIWKAFYQQNLHNVTNLIATVLIFLIVIYLQGFCVLLPLIPRNDHEQQPSYPIIKLFYTSYMPILLLSVLVSIFHLYSEFLHVNFSGNLFVDLLGKWKQSEDGGGQYSTPVGGIAYYITAPSSLADMAANPFHALFYLVFVLSTSALLSKAWTHASYSTYIHVAIQQREKMEPSTIRQLRRNIPTATALGGLCIGALTVLADITGAFSSASGILIAVTTISEYLEAFEKEKLVNK